jgi:FkbM family methyltransferase
MTAASTILRLRAFAGRLLSPARRERYRASQRLSEEIVRLTNYPRYKRTTTSLLGNELQVPDAASFLFIYREMFEKETYRFKSDSDSPVIIDCGANIGLSLIYFKKLYPKAKIIAFEPDPKIHDVLCSNISSFGLQDVTIINKALWSEDTVLNFYSEGADAGRLDAMENTKSVSITTDRLSRYLQSPVDFLKIDIEGAEYEVLKECASQLHNVQRIFVEYHSFTGKQQVLDEILAILRSSGFRYNINFLGLVSPQPFVKVNTYSGMDMQLNIYAYRE